MKRMTADELVDILQLQPHPEGGLYRETYRAAESISAAALPARFTADRSFCTGIYYLLRGTQRSALHRVRSDEMWHWYMGTSTLEVVQLGPDDTLRVVRVGLDLAAGDRPQHVVPAGHWFGARLADPEPDRFALVGCTVAPGFDFDDFELATPDLLVRLPRHEAALAGLVVR